VPRSGRGGPGFESQRPDHLFAMLYIILSDVHSNLEAFEAVRKTFPRKDGRKFVCVGDTVGYGSNPNEAVHRTSALTDINVMGNHDAAVLGRADLSRFNPHAKSAVIWTKGTLGEKEKEYLLSLPYVYKNKLFTAVHGTLHDPENFTYMLTELDAMRSFELLKTRICFVGHSHKPGVFSLRDGNLSYSSKKKNKLKADTKYIVNVGSVGQPRDGDPRACYSVFDTEKDTIEFVRVKYDIKTASDKILKAGLPSFLAKRLFEGR
jgi:diadenosine tetraphosphatase ApaH/serine/threonine PP2A family protein phosphatase